MEALRQAQKKYCSRAITVAIFVGFFLILAGQKPLGKGLILGSVFSAVNFILIGETLPMRKGQSKKRTFFLSIGSILLRYFFLAIPLIMAIKLEQFNLFAVIFGIFMIQLVIFTDYLFNLILSTRRKHR